MKLNKKIIFIGLLLTHNPHKKPLERH